MGEIKKIQIRGGFSDRMKIQSLNTEIQLTDFDDRTRIAIANLIISWYEMLEFKQYREYICESIAKDVFSEFISNRLRVKIEYNQEDFINDYLFLPISEGTYDEVLSLVEYITNLLKHIYYEAQKQNPYLNPPLQKGFDFDKSLNELFQSEFVGYRIIDGLITPISDEIEMKEIQITLRNRYDGCKSHIHKALIFLSDREHPDYKNSIKESISAVESICQIIVGDNKATLGKTLKKLDDSGIHLHKSMIEAFSKLYGYTSDQGGIRHAEGMFESHVSFEEAKYMLVSCCAFINFLISESCKNEK